MPLHAQSGLTIEQSGTHYSGATYRELVRDLRVKVAGGYVNVRRHWRQGRWWFNPQWANLQFTYADNNVSDDLPSKITRYDLAYTRVNGAGNVYAYLNKLTITRTDSGWRWADRKGNWIDYDAQGVTLAYGDRNGNRVSFRRNLAGFIEGVIDPAGAEVVTFTLNTLGNPTQVRDYSGRQVSYHWDANDRLTRVTDVTGKTWQYSYQDFSGSTLSEHTVLASRTDPDGTTVEFIHGIIGGGTVCVSGSGLKWVYDKNTHQWEAQYQTCHQFSTSPPTLVLLKTHDPLGDKRQHGYFYDAQARTYTLSNIDANGVWVQKTVDLDGELLEERRNGRLIKKVQKDGNHRITTDARGLITRTNYDQWRNPTKITYPDNTTVEMRYDPRYNGITWKKDERGSITETTYDAQGNKIQQIEAKGSPQARITTWTYTPRGQIASRTREADAHSEAATTRYQYDDKGNLTQITDPEGGITRFQDFDALGNPRTRIDPRGNTWSSTWDSAGNLLQQTDPLGRITRYAYDGAGNLIQKTEQGDPNTADDDRITQYQYDARNRRIRTQYPDGSSQTSAYDGARLSTITDETGTVIQTLHYDSEGNLAGSTDAAGNTISWDNGIRASADFPGLRNATQYPSYSETYGYDLRGRRTQIKKQLPAQTDPDAPARTLITKTRYDLAGNPIEQWDEANRASTRAYDALGRLTQSTDTAGHTTRYRYDNRDNLIEVINANNIALRRYAYDKNNHKTEEIWPDDSKTTYQYDAGGNLLQQIDRKGQITTYQYDEANRLIGQRHYADAAAQSADTPEKTITYSYDSHDNLIHIAQTDTDSNNQSHTHGITYQYDARDRITRTTTDFGPFQKTETRSYRPNGQLKTRTTAEGITLNHHYDAHNQLTRIELPGEGSLTWNAYQWNRPAQLTLPGGIVQSTNYDPLMRPRRIQSQTQNNTLILQRDYQYSATGNITDITSEHGAYSYQYDNADRLTQAHYPDNTQDAYSYDPVGNRITDQSTGTTPWEYAPDDRLLKAGAEQHQYDANGSLIQISNSPREKTLSYDSSGRLKAVTSPQNQPLARYRYDPLGRRIQKTTPTNTTYYLYGDEGLLGEYDPSGTALATYGYTPQSQYQTEPLWKKTPYGYAYYHRDHLGTPLMLTDKTNAIVWEARYKAFGERNIVTEAIANNLGFPGQYYDAESGLHYNYFRYYDPSTGRYITSDPIGLEGGVNVYGYVDDDPVNRNDIYGLISERNMPCQYYRKACSKYGCFYYCHSAKMICANAEWIFPFIVDNTTKEKLRCVKRCLVREDKKIHEKRNLMCGSGDCLKDSEIDGYHYTCFYECGLDPTDYPGVWPFNGL